MMLMIDNYDSFTFNLVQYFRLLGQSVKVIRNDEMSVEAIAALSPSCICISPGPGNPSEAGISLAVIRHLRGKIPILGVCLGHQCIAEALGARIIKGRRVMHGKTSVIEHRDSVLHEYLPNHFHVARYHSLVVAPCSLPDELRVTAWTQESGQQTIMAIEHADQALAGIQYHPESIATEHGLSVLENFLNAYI